VAKKKVTVVAASVSSTEAFLTVGLALELEVPTAAAASIPEWKVGEECWNSGLDGWLEVVVASIHLKAVAASIQLEVVVVAMLEAARLRETLPTASWVMGPYENPVTWNFDLWMSKNLSSELKKEESYTCDPSNRGVEGSSGALGRGPYEERPSDYTNYVSHLLSNWIRQIELIWDSYMQYP
jgi:hypothetical protein